jgi:hypothetical protein
MECPHCKKQLRLTIKEKSFGKEIEVTCSSCGGRFRTTIPYPAETHRESFRQAAGFSAIDGEDLRRLQPLVEEFGIALHDAVANDLRLREIVGKMRSAGYDASLMFEAVLGCNKCEDAEAEIHEPTPLVENGEVVPGAFTEEDEKWMKTYRIGF